jgi:uncharacterized membrane protein
MGSIVIVSLAFLFGALAQTFRRTQRPLLAVGWLSLVAGVVVALMAGLVP